MRSRHLLIALVLALCLLLGACQPAPPPRLVGYATLKADPTKIDATRLDALIFAFAHVQNGEVVLDAKHTEAFARLQPLRKRNPKLKLLISVGGWGADGFSDAAMTAASRKRFADSAVALLERVHADGLDVDWEYPGHSGAGIRARESDRVHFTLLLSALRRTMDHASRTHPDDPRHFLLTAALADGPFVDHVQLKPIAHLLDWINLMTYDFNNSMTPTTGHHAGLYRSAASTAPGDRYADKAVRQYLDAGVPARKLMLGAAFYARAFTDVRDRDQGLYQPYGKYVDSFDWLQLKAEYIDRHGFTRYWDAKARAPYLWNPHTRTFITYEDPQSLRAKADYVKQRRLGGVMYWEQGLDPTHELFDALANALKGAPASASSVPRAP
ncbi:glycoside hydrolase family 18 protein [Oleiagrimonas soli]|uniref:chitinase n=1 Tax=Oleiagrimonas soli TaxID=1543381 RepID=A0A841KFK4_9GAMM|nr:glycoside hydrolase family 18 protein [Oleiagrimonas soli]MBB6184413.1 chitinase [Oleiagrimonas soli]